MVQTFLKTTEFPLLSYIDKVVDVLVVQVVMVHRCRLCRRQSRFQGLQIVENIVEIPKIRTVQGGQTTESFGAALVRHVAQTEIVEDVEIGACLPTESAHPDVRHGTRLGVSSSCCGVCRARSRCGVCDAHTRGHVCTYLFRMSTRLQHPPFLQVTTRTVASTVFPTATVPFTSGTIVVRFAVHRQGRRHPCRGAEADPPDVSGDDRDSTVIVHRQGGRCPCRAGGTGGDVDSRDDTRQPIGQVVDILSWRRGRPLWSGRCKRRLLFHNCSTSTRWSMSP